MRELEQITDNEMIYAFIQAEAHASRWAKRYRESGLQPEDSGPNADPNNAEQNQRRRNALARGRGYGRDDLLFRGLPNNMTWYRVVVTVDELAAFMHLNYSTFIRLTGGSRLVRDGARNAETIKVDEDLDERILDLAQAVSKGERHPPLIAVAPDIDATPVILEGNTRASAYVRELPPEAEIEIILGVAPGVTAMTFF
jgi:hypothetical protein